MGFLDFFRRGREGRRRGYVPPDGMSLEDVEAVKEQSLHADSEWSAPRSEKERKDYIQELCEKMSLASRQIEEARVEYGAVTSYLTDMEKIDQASGEEREDLESAAREILTLTREREGYRSGEIRLSPAARQTMERYEGQMAGELKSMRENEEYQQAIKSDLRYLESEKGYLKYQREEIVGRQKYLRRIAVVTSVLVGILFALLMALAYVFQADMRPAFLLTVLMAAVSAACIFFEANKNRSSMSLTERKLKKAVLLSNKVKIKYVNNASVLDYSYEKLGVKSSEELSYIWGQYEEMKRRERQARANAEKLGASNEKLIAQLKDLGVEDADIWIHQPAAILDKKEMVEIRHRLNIRRQKLRERIDYNGRLKDDALEEIRKTLRESPELKPDAIRMLQGSRA